MDRRYRPMTPLEEVAARDAFEHALAAHPEWDAATVLRALRSHLHLTLADMAKVGRVSVPTLKNIEARRSSPTLHTLTRLLQPFGFRIIIGRVAADAGAGTPLSLRPRAVPDAPRTAD
jgi:transcriptional regulator with XRE-family HTH domain